MPKTKKVGKPSPQKNRITVQAQGGGIYESEKWAPENQIPTVADLISMLDKLEKNLSASEKQKRKTAFTQAREYVTKLVGYSAPPPLQASFPQPALRDGIRVDINVFQGKIQ